MPFPFLHQLGLHLLISGLPVVHQFYPISLGTAGGSVGPPDSKGQMSCRRSKGVREVSSHSMQNLVSRFLLFLLHGLDSPCLTGDVMPSPQTYLQTLILFTKKDFAEGKPECPQASRQNPPGPKVELQELMISSSEGQQRGSLRHCPVPLRHNHAPRPKNNLSCSDIAPGGCTSQNECNLGRPLRKNLLHLRSLFRTNFA
mmetsp:Transcript_29879/g.63586  ORF Transcript_29879/g.63586 Transcript_29879/m.63586 type:complete len:200 (-) Transcript_29879:89-688(-)